MSITDGVNITSTGGSSTVVVPPPMPNTFPYVENAPAIEDVLAKLAKEVPDEEWAKLATDDRATHRAALASEIADFVVSLNCKFLDRGEIAAEIRRLWGHVECRPAEGGR